MEQIEITIPTLCGLSLETTGNEDIALCSICPAFENTLRSCPSLATWAHVGLMFKPRWNQPATITGSEGSCRMQGAKTGSKDRE